MTTLDARLRTRGPAQGELVTEVQRGSLRGQGAALGWMLLGIEGDRE